MKASWLLSLEQISKIDISITRFIFSEILQKYSDCEIYRYLCVTIKFYNFNFGTENNTAGLSLSLLASLSIHLRDLFLSAVDVRQFVAQNHLIDLQFQTFQREGSLEQWQGRIF